MPVDRPPAGSPADGPHGTTARRLFVDANVFLRYLTNDIPEQADAAEAMLERAERGEVHLVTSVLVVAEVVWTLVSFYKRPREAVRDAVLALCHTPGLTVEGADLLVQAAEWHADENVDFADAYHAAWARAEGLDGVRTFNLKHFRRLDGPPAEPPTGS